MNTRQASVYMNTNPVTMHESSSMTQVIKSMNENNISHMLLTDSMGQLAGLISKTDLLKKSLDLLSVSSGKTFSSKAMEATLASHLMTEDFMSVKPTDNIEYVIELLLQREFHCLPVVDNSKLVGVITFSDLLKSYYQENG